jgi:small-conductance mechanosensitive channel
LAFADKAATKEGRRSLMDGKTGGHLDVMNLAQQAFDWVVASGLRILLIVILTFVAVKVVKVVIKRLMIRERAEKDEEYGKRARTLHRIVAEIASIGIIGIALIVILGELGIRIGPILAAAGVAGVAIGFGAQNLVRDVITGFFILWDDVIRVGDVVQIAGKGGLVEQVNLRYTILRDLAGSVHYIRNGEITTVTNMTKDFSYYVFDIGVAYRENVDQVIEVIKQVDADMRQDPAFSAMIMAPIEVLGLDQFGDSAVIVKARTKTKPIMQWSVGREFNKRLKKAFDERDIEIPFPHITFYAGKDKDGNSPPVNVQIEGESARSE